MLNFRLPLPITMTPREASTGREYTITGRLALGDLAASTAPSLDQARGLHVADFASPTGFEPVLAA